MRLCQDCRWLIDGRKCYAPQNALDDTGTDYVTGKSRAPKPIYITAQACREDKTTCGPDAAWFELKPAQAPKPAEACSDLGS